MRIHRYRCPIYCYYYILYYILLLTFTCVLEAARSVAESCTRVTKQRDRFRCVAFTSSPSTSRFVQMKVKV